MTIAQTLLAWYKNHGRSFTFRGSKDPYRIWVSEIMLQQTRTQTVGAYYDRFLRLFPTVETLAEADEEAVLKAWEGLGYYSRARNLHRCAKVVVAEHGGRFPRTAAELLTLPGIGPYTAAAIASIAYDEPVPAMDGNLQRVISRLYNVEEDIGIPSVRRRLTELGQGMMPEKGAGDMNQALMDLGATICLPGTPDCPACPLTAFCLAYKEGEPERLPRMAKKAPPREVPMLVLLLTKGDQVLVFQRQEALLKGLYVFHLTEDRQGAEDARRVLGHLHKAADKPRHLGTAKHVFTHRVWLMDIYTAEVDADFTLPGGRWVGANEIEQLPFPTAMRVAKQQALELLQP